MYPSLWEVCVFFLPWYFFPPLHPCLRWGSWPQWMDPYRHAPTIVQPPCTSYEASTCRVQQVCNKKLMEKRGTSKQDVRSYVTIIYNSRSLWEDLLFRFALWSGKSEHFPVDVNWGEISDSHVPHWSGARIREPKFWLWHKHWRPLHSVGGWFRHKILRKICSPRICLLFRHLNIR